MRRKAFVRQPVHAGAARACLLAACALAGSAASVAADDYPSRPIRLVVGFTAGGPTDIPARFLADRLTASLGRPVVVENKPGAGAMIAANDVLSHPRDGYDLLLCTYFDSVNTLLYRSVKYKLSDILGISLIAQLQLRGCGRQLAAGPDLHGADRLHQAASRPGELRDISASGSTQNLLAKRLEKLTGMKMTAIPYKGSAEATQEIVAGRNHLYIGPPLGVLPLYRGQAGQGAGGHRRRTPRRRCRTCRPSRRAASRSWLMPGSASAPAPARRRTVVDATQQPYRGDRQLARNIARWSRSRARSRCRRRRRNSTS